MKKNEIVRTKAQKQALKREIDNFNRQLDWFSRLYESEKKQNPALKNLDPINK